jgi:hypothetical protein
MRSTTSITCRSKCNLGTTVPRVHSGFFSANKALQPQQPLAQFFAGQLINLEWLQPGTGEHRLSAATGDLSDGAGHSLVTAYPVLRPDGEWALLIINKDQDNEHTVAITFDDSIRHRSGRFAGPVVSIVFGKDEYRWRPDVGSGVADPDGPPRRTTIQAGPDTVFTLPHASITVLRGRVGMPPQ